MAGMKRNRVSWVSCAVSDAVGACGSGSPRKETAVLVGWKKRSDNHVLVRMKAEAVLHASRGVDTGIIAETVERTERTVQEWPADWRATRMRSVLTGHAGNQNAAEPARAQKEDLKAVLARPPSQADVRAGFRDVPAIREVVRILFDVEHQADSSYRLLPRLCGPSLEPPFDGHRDETATTRRMAWATTRVKSLLDQGRKVHTARLRCAWSTRPRPAARSPPEDSAPDRPWTGRGRPSPSPVRSR